MSKMQESRYCQQCLVRADVRRVEFETDKQKFELTGLAASSLVSDMNRINQALRGRSRWNPFDWLAVGYQLIRDVDPPIDTAGFQDCDEEAAYQRERQGRYR